MRVFHAPGQSPYSVLVEQRGVDQLLLLESQVPLPCDKCSPSTWISGHSHPLSCWSWATEENVCQAMWRLWHPGKLALECRRGAFSNLWPGNYFNCFLGGSPLLGLDNWVYIRRQDWSGRGRFNPTVSHNFLGLALSQVYKITGVKMCSLRGYQPDEERVQEMVKLLTSGAAYFSWSHQGPSHTIDLTMAAQKVHRCWKTDRM